jgi:hypothetical protein
LDNEVLKQRQLYEKQEFLSLKQKWDHFKSIQFQSAFQMGNHHPMKPMRVYAVSASWFKEWEKFVQLQTCPMKHQIPMEINNYSICVHHPKSLPQAGNIEKEKKIHQLNKNSNFFKISEEMWNFLHSIYGGGPILPLANHHNPTTTTTTTTQKPAIAFVSKPRTNSLSHSQTASSIVDAASSKSFSQNSEPQVATTTTAPKCTPKLNSSISDSGLSKNVKKLQLKQQHSGLILKIPNI